MSRAAGTSNITIRNSRAIVFVMLAALLLQACATRPPASCENGGVAASECPPLGAVDDPNIADLQRRRSWAAQKVLDEMGLDPVQAAAEADIQSTTASGKILGPAFDDARNSLAAKIWMIENAKHTIDVMYYIYRDDMTGKAILAALCDAVIRGVDVRFMVDSLGSMTTPQASIGWLKVCEENAGWMVNSAGEVTTQRARVQLATFNAISNLSTSPNRRSHDKLLVTDGEFVDRAYMITGGRNIALDYYGFTAEGEVDPKAYRDMEILLRPRETGEEIDLGELTSGYYSLLFLYRGNRLNRGANTGDISNSTYNRQSAAYDALEELKALPLMQPHFESMDEYMTSGFIDTTTRLAHNMTNLNNKGVVRNVSENFAGNPNSILYLLGEISDLNDETAQARLVSPYLFLANYREKDGEVILDEAARIREYMEENPEARLEIVTNSVMTSDNFSTQSIIDFDTAPRLLLPEDLRDQWLALDTEDEAASELVNSPEWQAAINHPQIAIYETGRLDSHYFEGGMTVYGKLHAKFWQEEQFGFVGTTNFDYRSRLYNNEMGYFFMSEDLSDELKDDFESLKSISLRWGSPEWLEMRRQMMQVEGTKGWSTRKQRTIFKTLKKTGLIWLF